MWARAQKEGSSRVFRFQSRAGTQPTETDPWAVMMGGDSGFRLGEGRFILAPSSREVSFIAHLWEWDLVMFLPLLVG